MKYGTTGPSSRPRAAVQARPTLLVVDDEPVMGAVLRRIFGRTHEVTVAASGREALALIDDGAEPDVVLCDVVMPDLDGLQVYEAVRAKNPRLAARFVFVTGGVLHESDRCLLESIPNPVLDKPFELDVVREAVRRVQLFRT